MHCRIAVTTTPNGASISGSPSIQQNIDGQIGGDEGLLGATKRGVAQAGKPRAIKTPIQKEALEAAFRSAPTVTSSFARPTISFEVALKVG